MWEFRSSSSNDELIDVTRRNVAGGIHVTVYSSNREKVTRRQLRSIVNGLGIYGATC